MAPRKVENSRSHLFFGEIRSRIEKSQILERVLLRCGLYTQFCQIICREDLLTRSADAASELLESWTQFGGEMDSTG